MNYRLSEIASIVGGRLEGADLRVGSVFADSRSSVPADMFAAIAGRNHDGHDYVGELHTRGVRAFLVERSLDLPADASVVVVPAGVLTALQTLAADWRGRFKGRVAAITGSNGKTVVKEWAAAAAPSSVKLFRSPRSYNSQLGVPLSVLMMTGDEDAAIFEAGISRPGEMAALARILRPDIGVFTTLGDAHQENFASLQQKFEEKALLFEGADTIIYNSKYPVHFEAPRLVDVAGGAGEENALLVEALWRELGWGISAGCVPPMAMRLEVKEGINGSLIVDDTYNSDLNSLSIALDYLRSVAGGRHQTLILGDILQSGLPDKALYEQVAALAQRAGVSEVIGIGERIAQFFPINFSSVEDFLRLAGRDDIAGRALLIKGNRTARFERLTHALALKSHTTTLTVDLDALVHNLNALRVPGLRTVAMVKANAYGHGAREIAAAMQHQGVDMLAVAFADEGVSLREGGITMPIVVLNADSDSFDLMIDHHLEPEIYNFESLSAFADALARHGERNWPVHLKLDTGMHRLGFGAGDLSRLTEELSALSGTVRVGSIFSHLSCADEPAQDDFTRSQIAAFDSMSSLLTEGLGYRPLRHLANSAGAVRFPEARFDMVRLGLGLYGFGLEGLRPISTLRTRIVQVRDLPAGAAVGYGRQGVLAADTRVAIIPMGYADGLNRRLGMGRWGMQVLSAECPTVGRISMDTCAIAVPISAQVGDEVVIFGFEGHTVADMSDVLETIPYEVMTSVSLRVKRIYIKE